MPSAVISTCSCAACPMAAAVLAGESFDLLAGPESGHHESLTEAEEALAEAKARLATLEKKLIEASAALEVAVATDGSDPADDFEDLDRQREIVLRTDHQGSGSRRISTGRRRCVARLVAPHERKKPGE